MRKHAQVDLVFPSTVSDGARDLISRLLVKDPAGRLTLAEVRPCLSHRACPRCVEAERARRGWQVEAHPWIRSGERYRRLLDLENTKPKPAAPAPQAVARS